MASKEFSLKQGACCFAYGNDRYFDANYRLGWRGGILALRRVPGLTNRQHRVYLLGTLGLELEEIAQEIAYSFETVKKDRGTINRSLGAANIHHATTCGLQTGLLRVVKSGNGPRQPLARDETEVVRFIANGDNRKETATDMHFGERSVRRRLDAISTKLDVHGMGQIITASYMAEIIRPDELPVCLENEELQAQALHFLEQEFVAPSLLSSDRESLQVPVHSPV